MTQPSGPEQSVVFQTWCQLTGTDPRSFGTPELESFLARPQVAALSRVPAAVLFDAGMSAARRGSLPLERWLAAVRLVRPGAAAR